jgi:hypothetical protein
MTSAKDTRFPVCTLHLAFLLSFGLLGVPDFPCEFSIRIFGERAVQKL